MRAILNKETLITPKSVKFLYNTRTGRLLLKILTQKWISKTVGAYLDSKLSCIRIKKYIKKNNIDMTMYVEKKYESFNDFFTREIKSEKRPFALENNAFPSPSDGKLSIYKINENSTFNIKGFDYTTQSLLNNPDLAIKYADGICLVIRLSVEDYHRYFYIDDCNKEKGIYIQGKFHTVQPYALEKKKVFSENCREYTVMHTENFGMVTQIEVGAMMVGKIANKHKDSGYHSKGEEKGMFEFGGSTIVLLIEKDKVNFDEEFFTNTANGNETYVLCGEKIGTATK